MTKCCISWMVAAEDSAGAFITMTTDPMIHKKHPIFPTILSLSLRKMAEPMVVITTDNAPNGVTNIASTKAYATKLQISPMIMRVMPVHQNAFFKYPYPSPATSLYFSFAFNSPIFFKINETPMKRPDATASDMPMALYTGGRVSVSASVEVLFARL